jgi:predicted metalloprotease with PDZ domain
MEFITPVHREALIRSLLSALLAVCVSLCLCTSAAAQPIYAENQISARGVEIDYTVQIRNPISHLYDVEISIKGIREPSVSVSMPAWTPGAYRIENYARNVQDFRAFNARNQQLPWEQTDKQTWRIAKQPADDVQVRYQVFSALLTDQMADLAPPATFMYVVGQKHVACTVKYNAPSGWKIYTGLEKRADRYFASDYDIFIDAPAFIGDFKVLEFETGGARHYLVFSKRDISLSAPQVTSDVQDIVEAAARMFGGLPYKQYFFLFKVQAQAANSVEHLNSTRITVGENDFVTQSSYRQVLATVSHEFFHLWNVKRIRPAVLGPFDYTREVHTRLLWMFEGITSYYGDLMLLRAGIDIPQEYLSRMAVVIDSHEHSPGRHLMSAEEASWNTWTRSDNADNNTISYYTKGELIGLLLDIEIRARTKNQKSLDDVMRYLMQTYANNGIGFPEDGFLKAVETVAGSDFHEFFEAVVQGRKELDYNRYLRQAGLSVEVQLQPGSIYLGIEFEPGESGLPRIRRVAANSPAERAKLDAGDVLVAMNDERVSFENFRSRLHSHAIGETLKLTVLRNQRLVNVNIVPVEFQDVRWQLNEMVRSTPQQLEIRNAWLGTK